jgi:2'-5' RNA ligase
MSRNRSNKSSKAGDGMSKKPRRGSRKQGNQSSDTMRMFAAVEVPEEIQQKVHAYAHELEGLFEGVKWVSPENLHLTLKFLGDVEPGQVDEIKDALDDAMSKYGPFELGFADTGFFPSEKRPRVIWVGADGEIEQLVDMFQTLEGNLEPLGFDREARTFSPHLTIGRVRKFERITVPPDLKHFEPVSFTADTIALIKSTLTPQGPIYEKLHTCSLLEHTTD